MPHTFALNGEHNNPVVRSRAGSGILKSVLCGAIFVSSLYPAVSSAQIPGIDPSADTVISDAQGLVTVQVNSPNLTNGTVSGQIINKSASTITCNGFPTTSQADSANTRTPGLVATRSQIVADSLDYYAKFPYKSDPMVAVDAPVIGMINVDLGSVSGLVPPFAANLIWPDAGARANIGAAVTDARIAGELGTQSTISIPANNGTVGYTVQLGRPSNGNRSQFSAGVFLACEISGKKHVFGGFENGQRPGPSGSLGEIFPTGRFGS